MADNNNLNSELIFEKLNLQPVLTEKGAFCQLTVSVEYVNGGLILNAETNYNLKNNVSPTEYYNSIKTEKRKSIIFGDETQIMNSLSSTLGFLFKDSTMTNINFPYYKIDLPTLLEKIENTAWVSIKIEYVNQGALLSIDGGENLENLNYQSVTQNLERFSLRGNLIEIKEQITSLFGNDNLIKIFN
jgi:hypothetical protein